MSRSITGMFTKRHFAPLPLCNWIFALPFDRLRRQLCDALCNGATVCLWEARLMWALNDSFIAFFFFKSVLILCLSLKDRVRKDAFEKKYLSRILKDYVTSDDSILKCEECLVTKRESFCRNLISNILLRSNYNWLYITLYSHIQNTRLLPTVYSSDSITHCKRP